MNQAIFFDVDNTLVCREKNKIYKSTLQAIEDLKNNKVKIAIATGRSLAMVKQETFHQLFKTIISANGSIITVDDKVIYKQPMNHIALRQLLTDFETQEIPYCIHLLTESKGKVEDLWIQKFSAKYNMPLSSLDKNLLDRLDDLEVFQINAHIKDHQIERMKERYPQFNFVKLIDVEEGYDVFNKNCSKGTAIKYIKENETNQAMKYYAFGDGFNDLEMFQEVDYAIAMGNSCEPLKECAHYVTDAIHEDGIYNALRYLKLI